jgi:hypothetical protein
MANKIGSSQARSPANQSELGKELSETGRRLNQASKDFLRVDAETALTFTQAALTTDNPEKKSRNTQNARRAYDTIQRLSARLTYTDSEQAYMLELMARLEKDLERLGEKL